MRNTHWAFVLPAVNIPFNFLNKRTHFADSVLRDPVVSISPARNSWYLVHAMPGQRSHRVALCLKRRGILFPQMRSVGGSTARVGHVTTRRQSADRLVHRLAASECCRKWPNRLIMTKINQCFTNFI